MASGFGGQAVFELSPPPMIGQVPATTVVYILLGFGALLPVLLLSTVAIALCVRRRSRKLSADVFPVDVAVDGCHSNALGFAVDIDDDIAIEDVFAGEKTRAAPNGWELEKKTTARPGAGRGRVDFRKRTAEVGSKAEVHSVSNPDVYFRSRVDQPQPICEVPHVAADELFPWSSDQPRTPPPSCDVTMTSSCSRSDATSMDRKSNDDVIESDGSTPRSHVATTLDRVQSMTRSILQQEEEKVLR